MKDVSSRHLLNYRSAHPETMKINVLVNEATRIMKNCSKYLPQEEVNKHLQYFVNRMQYSGYPQEYRYEVLLRAFNRDRERREQSEGDVGTRVTRRTRKKGRDWYDRSKFDGVMLMSHLMANSNTRYKMHARGLG